MADEDRRDPPCDAASRFGFRRQELRRFGAEEVQAVRRASARRSCCWATSSGCTGTACTICRPHGRQPLVTRKRRAALITVITTWACSARTARRSRRLSAFRRAWGSASGFTSKTIGWRLQSQWLRKLGVRYLRTGVSWADWFRPDAEQWFDRQMNALDEFDVTMTLCFTPEHLGIERHYTSPPANPQDFADFATRMVRRYAPDAGPRQCARAKRRSTAGPRRHVDEQPCPDYRRCWIRRFASGGCVAARRDTRFASSTA